jgi:hypothetical protein
VRRSQLRLLRNPRQKGCRGRASARWARLPRPIRKSPIMPPDREVLAYRYLHSLKISSIFQERSKQRRQSRNLHRSLVVRLTLLLRQSCPMLNKTTDELEVLLSPLSPKEKLRGERMNAEAGKAMPTSVLRPWRSPQKKLASCTRAAPRIIAARNSGS